MSEMSEVDEAAIDNKAFEDSFKPIPAGETPLSARVASMEQNRGALATLCGSILATLVVNRHRRTLHCDTPSHTQDFDRLLMQWQDTFNGLDNDKEAQR